MSIAGKRLLNTLLRSNTIADNKNDIKGNNTPLIKRSNETIEKAKASYCE